MFSTILGSGCFRILDNLVGLYQMKPLWPLVARTGIGLDLNSLQKLRGTWGALDLAPIVSYLTNSPSIMAIMSFSEDQLGHAFTRPGGHSILSDGTFFWRRDGADYVKNYKVALPVEFIIHGQQRNWQPATFTLDQTVVADRAIRSFLYSEASGESDRGNQGAASLNEWEEMQEPDLGS